MKGHILDKEIKGANENGYTSKDHVDNQNKRKYWLYSPGSSAL